MDQMVDMDYYGTLLVALGLCWYSEDNYSGKYDMFIVSNFNYCNNYITYFFSSLTGKIFTMRKSGVRGNNYFGDKTGIITTFIR